MNLPWYMGNGREVFADWRIALAPLVIWSLVWSGLALWHAARRGEKWWFVLFLLFHSAGILEIIYLVFVVKIFSPPAKKPPNILRKR